METQTKVTFKDLEDKELILSLIQAELRNSKLIHGLNTAGILVETFYTNLAAEIFGLIGFQKTEITDQLCNHYFQILDKQIEQKTDILIKNIRANALEIYNELLIERMKGINFANNLDK